MSTLGTFPPSESRTGYVHTVDGPIHLSSRFSANKLPPKYQQRPWNEIHRFGSHLKAGAPCVEV